MSKPRSIEQSRLRSAY